MAGRRPVLSLVAAALVAASTALLLQPSQATSPPPVVFDHKTGNEWWVEVVLSGSSAGSVTSVQAMDTGGSWVTMQKKSWGAWAASFRIEPGNLVKFRAQVSTSWYESCWFTHPAGVEQCGGSTTTTTTSGGFDATFSGVKGNEWWVEVKVAANQALAGVDARVNCGTTWRALTLRDWGSWAASFNIPAGSKVDFRARSTSGASDLSGGYTWTAATPTTGCGGSTTTTTTPPGFDATFTNVKGNEWWVQANVAATGGTLSEVQVRFDRSAWMPLTKQSWGGWAGSYRLTQGTTIELRAVSTTGATDTSGCYLWTLAQPTACIGDWPREGTFYRYQGHWGTWDLRRGVTEEASYDVYTVYTNGDWRSTCTEHYMRFEGGYDAPDVNQTTVTHGTLAPILAPVAGENAELHMTLPKGCGTDNVPVQKERDGYHAVKANGQLFTLAVNDFRQTSESYNGEDADVRADRHQGVLLKWHYGFADYACECYSEGFVGEMVDTNIPLGPKVTREQQKAMQPAWPVAGSTAVLYGDSGTPAGWHNETYLEMEYNGSAWTGMCQLRAYGPGSNPVYGPTVYREIPVTFAPMKGTPMASQGALVSVTLMRDCKPVSETMRVLAPELYRTHAMGNFEQFQEWTLEAVRADEDPDGVHDEDAWYDPETGLMLEWNWDHGADWFTGRLLHTDAPMR